MPISISIASGKGGVGKTSIAVNLALTMASLGSRVTSVSYTHLTLPTILLV